jgi:Glutathione-dependent formaldehyde-activating enzyme
VVTRRERVSLSCARVALDASACGRSTSSLGGRPSLWWMLVRRSSLRSDGRPDGNRVLSLPSLPAFDWSASLGLCLFSVGLFSLCFWNPRAVRASSKRGAREFCASCGTQIAFRASPDPATVDVNVGALDNPAKFPPQKHIYCGSAIPWLLLRDSLPRYDAATPVAGT